jgi:hypothetical protein
MRTCPTCGEFYEDGPLAFCLADGTPLADVDPSSEKWEEAARAVREKAEKLSRHGRRLKWRRVAVRVVTTLLTAVVVCVVVINGVIYLGPPRDVVADGGTGGGGGGNGNDNGGGRGNDNDNDNGGGNDNDNDGGGGNDNDRGGGNDNIGHNGNVNRSLNVNRNSNINRNGNTNRNSNVNFNRNGNINRNGNGGGNGNDNSARCSAADRAREWEAILRSCRVTWETAIEGERPQIIAEFARRGVEPRLGRIDYAPPAFTDDCKQAYVTARYTWLLTSPTGDVPVPRTKPFACRKLGRGWACG